jgi:hypothetical protein
MSLAISSRAESCAGALTRTWVVITALALPAVATAQQLAILPADGDPKLAAKLNSGLHKAVAARIGRPVFGPAELQTRLWRAPGVAERVQSARAAVEEAENKLLHMDRPRSLAASGRAIRLLLQVGGRYHTPRLLSRAQLARARGLLLKPVDAMGARAALRAAFDAAPQMPEDRLAPKVLKLMREVRAEPRRPNPPTIGELSSMSRSAAAAGLVWVAGRPRNNGVEIDLLIYDRQSRTLGRRLRRRVPGQRMVEETASLVAGAIGAHGPLALAAPPPKTAKPQQSTPWYRKWWVWTLVGAAVVAGTTAGIVVATSAEDETSVTFHFK